MGNIARQQDGVRKPELMDLPEVFLIHPASSAGNHQLDILFFAYELHSSEQIGYVFAWVNQTHVEDKPLWQIVPGTDWLKIRRVVDLPKLRRRSEVDSPHLGGVEPQKADQVSGRIVRHRDDRCGALDVHPIECAEEEHVTFLREVGIHEPLRSMDNHNAFRGGEQRRRCLGVKDQINFVLGGIVGDSNLIPEDFDLTRYEDLLDVRVMAEVPDVAPVVIEDHELVAGPKREHGFQEVSGIDADPP